MPAHGRHRRRNAVHPDKFLAMNPRTLDINNFPILAELDTGVPWSLKQAEISYIGGLGAIRGIRGIVRAGELLRCPARIDLAGRFSEPRWSERLRPARVGGGSMSLGT